MTIQAGCPNCGWREAAETAWAAKQAADAHLASCRQYRDFWARKYALTAAQPRRFED